VDRDDFVLVGLPQQDHGDCRRVLAGERSARGVDRGPGVRDDYAVVEKTEEAAVLLWALTSFHVWDDLVIESGLAPDRYVEIVTTAALAALASPINRQARAKPARSPRTGRRARNAPQ
jgi:hypothetical protein